MLKISLQAHGVKTVQAQNDADVLTVDTAVEFVLLGAIPPHPALAFRKSKLKFLKLYLKSPDVKRAAAVFRPFLNQR